MPQEYRVSREDHHQPAVSDPKRPGATSPRAARMQSVRQAIDAREAVLSGHPFFHCLERDAPFQEARRFAPQMTFWVFVFQDVLRLNEAQVTDPALLALVHQHGLEDSGHERWFLSDVTGLEGAVPTLPWLFSSPHAPTRDAAYALMAEVFRATSDAERIALLLSLEAAAHAFFPHVSSYLHRQGQAEGLRYFSGMHLLAEAGHEMFEAEMEAFIHAMVLTEAESDAALALVERVFAAFSGLFDHLVRDITAESLGLAAMAASLPVEVLDRSTPAAEAVAVNTSKPALK